MWHLLYRQASAITDAPAVPSPPVGPSRRDSIHARQSKFPKRRSGDINTFRIESNPDSRPPTWPASCYFQASKKGPAMTFTDALKDSTRSYGGPPAPVAPDPPSPTPYDVERRLLDELSAGGDCRTIHERLARHYAKHRLPADAFRRLKWLLAHAPDAESEASYEHQMGLLHESFGDFPAAAAHYRRGLSLEPSNPLTAYWLNNLLAYCLQTGGQFKEAEFYVRRAIQVLPILPNAYKNLGLALKGQERFQEAAEAFVNATKADPSDGRAVCLLDNLLAAHPELLPIFQADANWCWHAVVIGRLAEAELKRRGKR